MYEELKRFEFKTDPDNGMLIGMEGCHYNTEAEAFYYDQIGLCGCGDPEALHQFFIDCLSSTDESGLINHGKVIDLVKNNTELVAEFVLHFLDKINLTEHGSSVYGSWLTERGKQALEVGAMVESNS